MGPFLFMDLSWGLGRVGMPPQGSTGILRDCTPSPRTELLKLLLTCFSEAMYLPPAPDSGSTNPWVQFFCSTENR